MHGKEVTRLCSLVEIEGKAGMLLDILTKQVGSAVRIKNPDVVLHHSNGPPYYGIHSRTTDCELPHICVASVAFTGDNSVKQREYWQPTARCGAPG